MLPIHQWSYDEFYDRVEAEVLKLSGADLSIMRQCMSKASVHEVFDLYLWEAGDAGAGEGVAGGFFKPRNEAEVLVLARAIYESGLEEIQNISDYEARLARILSQLDQNGEIEGVMHALVSMAKAEHRDLGDELRSPFLCKENRPLVEKLGSRLNQLGGGQFLRETYDRLRQLGVHPVDLRELASAWRNCGQWKA